MTQKQAVCKECQLEPSVFIGEKKKGIETYMAPREHLNDVREINLP